MPKKVDLNQPELVRALRGVGASVQTIHTIGMGCPDLLVGFRGHCFLLELKSATGRLTHYETEWQRSWNGHVAIVRTIDEALRAIGIEVES